MTRSRGARAKSAGGPRGKRTKLRRTSKVARQGPSSNQKARIDVLARQLAEARDRETATAEVLKVIANSAGELESVFEAMLEKAVRLCGAKFGVLWLAEGGGFRSVALY